MMSKKIILLLLVSNFILSGCIENKEQTGPPTKPLTITKEMAETLAKLPLRCAQKEFPNKLNQTLTDGGEIGLPKTLHPAFYGCFDWHSSVHGHWMLVKLLSSGHAASFARMGLRST